MVRINTSSPLLPPPSLLSLPLFPLQDRVNEKGVGSRCLWNKETMKGDKIIWHSQENCKAIWRYWNRLSKTVWSATGSYIIMAGEICNTYLHRHLSWTYQMCSQEWSYTGLHRYRSKIWRASCRPVARVESWMRYEIKTARARMQEIYRMIAAGLRVAAIREI